MAELQSGWQVKGTYNEACASEGACPYYFGRGRTDGCRYFMVFRIEEGEVNHVDLSGITLIYAGDIPHPSFEELLELGSEGAIYISDNASPQQREILDVLAVNNMGAAIMKKVFEVKYVNIEVEDDGHTAHFKMPFGEMEQYLSTGADGKTPVRLENQSLPFLSNVKTAHTPHWTYSDLSRHFDYRDRCGIWADFAFAG